MSKQISSLSVILTANLVPFANAFKGAGTVVSDFTSRVESVGASVLKLTGVGAAVAGAFGGFSIATFVKDQAEAIDSTAKLSDRLGVATEALSGLQYAGSIAHVSSEQLTGGLEKMLKALGEAAGGSQAAGDAFTSLGLDAQSLIDLPTDQAFETIAQAMKNIPNPAQRAAAAIGIFGRSGQELLPLMMRGADGIKAAISEAEKLGVTFNRVDAAKVEQANDAFTRMGAVFKGAGDSLAIQLSPYIEAATTKFVEMATAGGGIGPKIVNAVEWVAKAIAEATDYANLLPMAFYGIRAAVLQTMAESLNSIDYLGEGISSLLNMLPGVKVSWTDTFKNLSTGLAVEAAKDAAEFQTALTNFKTGANATAVTKYFDEIRASAQKNAQATADASKQMRGAWADVGEEAAQAAQKAGAAITSIQKELATFGLSDSQKKLFDFDAIIGDSARAQMHPLLSLKGQLENITNFGAPQPVANLGGLAAQRDEMQKLLGLKDQLESITKINTGDPLSDFAAQMEQLQKLYAQGVVTADQFKAIRDAAHQSMTDQLQQQAKAVIESVQTPTERYQAEMKRLSALFEGGAISQEVFGRAAAKAKNDILGTTQALNDQVAAMADVAKTGSAESALASYSAAWEKMTTDIGSYNVTTHEHLPPPPLPPTPRPMDPYAYDAGGPGADGRYEVTPVPAPLPESVTKDITQGGDDRIATILQNILAADRSSLGELRKLNAEPAEQLLDL